MHVLHDFTHMQEEPNNEADSLNKHPGCGAEREI